MFKILIKYKRIKRSCFQYLSMCARMSLHSQTESNKLNKSEAAFSDRFYLLVGCILKCKKKLSKVYKNPGKRQIFRTNGLMYRGRVLNV